jgi:hypothetical protein
MSKDNKIVITLTNARPLQVSKVLWPLIARATEDRDHNNQELFERYYLRVRQHCVLTEDPEKAISYHGSESEGAAKVAPHEDGRVVVYGWHETSYQGSHGIEAGEVCSLDEAPAVIRQVGEAIGAPEHLITSCCGDLPPVDADAAE